MTQYEKIKAKVLKKIFYKICQITLRKYLTVNLPFLNINVNNWYKQCQLSTANRSPAK